MVYDIDANEMAAELGNPRVANMIVLGAFARTTDIVSAENLEAVIRTTFGAKGADLVELNLKAFNLWQG